MSTWEANDDDEPVSVLVDGDHNKVLLEQVYLNINS